MSPRTCKALVIREKYGKPTLVEEQVAIPRPASNQALIKVAFAAQNPTDVLCFDNKIFGDGRVLGCDFAGRVDAVGSNVSRLKKGDKVAGLIWGGEIKGLGAYSDYTIADENICFKIPDNIPLEQAATVPLAATTAWLALFRSQSLNIDRTLGLDVELLVWAGSSRLPRAFNNDTEIADAIISQRRSLCRTNCIPVRLQSGHSLQPAPFSAAPFPGRETRL
ncbi:Zinc-type alcohol dehydrogenase-like protein C2E1P3,01 [Ilyonectria robusta]